MRPSHLSPHCTGIFKSLALALLLGKRKGWPREGMHPHNLPLTVLGTGIQTVRRLIDDGAIGQVLATGDAIYAKGAAGALVNLFASGLPNVDTLGVRGGDIHSEAEHAWPESVVERAQHPREQPDRDGQRQPDQQAGEDVFLHC